MAHRANRFTGRYAATALVVAVVAAGLASTVGAQPPVSRNFEQNAPAVGEMMPDVLVHDREGVALRLRDLLRERPTVLILGCLT
jgi:hypothetical protein